MAPDDTKRGLATKHRPRQRLSRRHCEILGRSDGGTIPKPSPPAAPRVSSTASALSLLALILPLTDRGADPIVCASSASPPDSSVFDSFEPTLSSPIPYELTQPDGTSSPPIVLTGSPHFYQQQDDDGYTLVPDPDDGFMKFGEVDPGSGRVVPSKIKFGARDESGKVVNPAKLGFKLGVQPTPEAIEEDCGQFCLDEVVNKEGWEPEVEEEACKGLLCSLFKRRLGRGTGSLRGIDMTDDTDRTSRDKARALRQLELERSHRARRLTSIQNGRLLNLVLPIQFSNHPSTNLPPITSVHTLFNAINGDSNICPTGSVRDVFYQSSYGQLNVISTVVPWIALSRDEKYYADGKSGMSASFPEALQEALDKLDSDPNFTFLDYDADGNGMIDAITFVHSGYGAELGGQDCTSAKSTVEDRIWSHKWKLSPKWVSSDGITVEEYHISPALHGTCGNEMGRIGTIAHELGHFLGLPDLYGGNANPGNGIGNFGLMGNSWGWDSSQLYPPIASPWSKWEMGWLNPDVIDSSGRYTLPPSAVHPRVFKITHNFPSGEYLLVENRQALGLDAKMPNGGGLVIWHIDETALHNVAGGYPGSSEDGKQWPYDGKHYRVSVVPADGSYGLEKGTNRGNGAHVYRPGNALGEDENVFPSTASYQGGVLANTGIRIFDIVNLPKSGGDDGYIRFAVQFDGESMPPTDSPTASPTLGEPKYVVKSKDLLSTYVGGTGSYGNQFDVKAVKDVTITHMAIHTRVTPADPPMDIEVYTKPGTWVGNEYDPLQWTKVCCSQKIVGEGLAKRTIVPKAVFLDTVAIQAGQVQAFYVTSKNPDLRYTKAITGETGDIQNGNLDLQILNGDGIGFYPFGGHSPRRLWNGVLHYDVEEIERTSGNNGGNGYLLPTSSPAVASSGGTVTTGGGDTPSSVGSDGSSAPDSGPTSGGGEPTSDSGSSTSDSDSTSDGGSMADGGSPSGGGSTSDGESTTDDGEATVDGGSSTLGSDSTSDSGSTSDGGEPTSDSGSSTSNGDSTSDGGSTSDGDEATSDNGSSMSDGGSTSDSAPDGGISSGIGSGSTISGNDQTSSSTNGGVQLNPPTLMKTSSFSGNSGSYGMMFEVIPLKTLTIQSMDFHTDLTEPTRVQIWYRRGSYVGNERDATAWAEVCDTEVVGKGYMARTLIPAWAFDDVYIQEGERVSIYITLPTAKLRYTKEDEGGTSIGQTMNADLKMLPGAGIGSYPFGSHLAPRFFNGALHYATEYVPAPPPTHAPTITPLVVSSNKQEVVTTFSSGNGGYGSMFDVSAKSGKDLVITTLDVHTDSTTDIQVEVYTVRGTYATHAFDPTAWDLICNTTVKGMGYYSRSKLPESDFAKIYIRAGDVQGFYVSMDSPTLRYSDASAVGDVWSETNEIEVRVGGGLSMRTSFTGLYEPRMYNGIVHYVALGDDESDSPSITPDTSGQATKSPTSTPSSAPPTSSPSTTPTLRPTTSRPTVLNPTTSLTSTFEGGSGAFGNLFDISLADGSPGVIIESFDIHTDRTYNVTCEVWTHVGTAIGTPFPDERWKMISSSTIKGMGKGNPTPIPKNLFQPVKMSPGRVRGFLVVLTTADMRYSFLNEGQEVGDVIAEDGHVRVKAGDGATMYPFTTRTVSTGRVWNGNVHYSVLGPNEINTKPSLTTTFDGGSGSFGNLFDVVLAQGSPGVIIESFDVHTDRTYEMICEVWVRLGTAIDAPFPDNSWKLIANTTVTGAGNGNPTEIPRDQFRSIKIGPDQIWGFIVTFTAADMRYGIDGVRGEIVAENENLLITVGDGITAYPFRLPGHSSKGRIWNGKIHYTTLPDLS